MQESTGRYAPRDRLEYTKAGTGRSPQATRLAQAPATSSDVSQEMECQPTEIQALLKFHVKSVIINLEKSLALLNVLLNFQGN